jgi:uncharacterized protein
MLFVCYCTDKPNHLDMRTSVRPDHLVHLNGLGSKLKAAGPFLDDAGNMMGSLVILEAENRAEAEQIAAADPYAKAGLFASVEIRAWRWTLKNPEAS